QRFLELQDRLIAMREEMRAQAMRDPLTGLLNRAAILEALHRELERSSREEKPVGLVLADLDHFKKINDSFGHLAGDAVLREAARRMLAVVRPYDFIGRYGGEEFLIVFPGAGTADTLGLAERLRHCVRNGPLELPEGPIALSMSLGAGSFAGGSRREVSAAVRAVDEALYRAKRGGRNRTELAAESLAEYAGNSPQRGP
ncbi:MAG TPA: GGDEF domain-containing protein, partial [Terriglobia bacterium]|nr:GGDEF domain-containing protein [Terriglobia bacterium]